jgi:hypothetical protein
MSKKNVGFRVVVGYDICYVTKKPSMYNTCQN